MKSLVVLLILSSSGLVACVDTSTAVSTTDAPVAARFGKGAPAADSVRLAMQVADGSSYRIQSDGLGEYVNGVSGMNAVIDATGNLQITPANATGSQRAERRLNISYASGQRSTFEQQLNFKIKSNRTNNGNPRLQDMTVGSALCYNVTIAHRDSAVQFVGSYNPAAYPSSSYALVTRTGSATWTVQSHGTAITGLACGAPDTAWVTGTNLLVKRGGDFTVGSESQAFRFDLRALP